MKSRIILLWIGLAACASGESIVTGPESGNYYSVGTAISEILEDFHYTVETSDGSVENMRRLFESIPVEDGPAKPRANLAIMQSDVIYRARKENLELPVELEPFREQIKTKVQTLIALYPEYLQILVAQDSEIEGMFQLSEKILFIGKESSGTRLNAQDILSFLQIHKPSQKDQRYTNVFTIGDLRKAHAENTSFDESLKIAIGEKAKKEGAEWEKGVLESPESTDALVIDFSLASELMKVGLIDAAFANQGSIIKNDKLRHLYIPDDLIAEFRHEYDWYGVRSVDLNLSRDRSVLFTRANLVALSHEDEQGLSRKAAERITKLIYENRLELASRVPNKLDFFVRDQMVRRVTDQLHAGSRDYFKSENIIPRMTFSELLLIVPLILVFLTIVINALRNRGWVARALRSEFAARIYSPGSPFQKIWDFFYRIICGSWIWIVAWMSVIVFATVVYLIRITEKHHAVVMDIEDPFVGVSFWQAAFWMLTFATTGFNQDIYPNTQLAKMLAVVVPISGLGLTLFVLIKHTFKNDRENEKRAHGISIPKGLKNHVIVCGWNDRVPSLLRDLTSLSSPLKPGARAVVIAETDEEKPLETYGIDRKRVSFLRGRSSDYEKLDRAGITRAIGAIVVAGNRKVEDNNNRSILTCTAIRHTLRKEGVKDEDFPIIAELYYESNKPYFEQSGVKKLVCIKTLAKRMISHAALNPGVSGLLLSLLRFSTSQVSRAIPVQDLRIDGDSETVVGKKFWDALIELRKSNYLLVAVWRSDRDTKYPSLEVEFRPESPYLFCPTTEDLDYEIKAEDKLLVIQQNRTAEDRDIRFLRGGTAQRFLFQEEKVLIIGNGWVGTDIADVLALRAKEVLQLVVGGADDKDRPVGENEYRWIEEKHGNVTLVRTSGRLDEDFYREFADRLSQMTRAVILGPDRRGREKQPEVFHDDETIMHAKALRRVAGEVFASGNHFHILAEMRCIENLELFHDSGIDQPVPTTALVEECLVQMIFHRGVVSEFFLKAMSYSAKNNKGRLKRIALSTMEEILGVDVIGKTFDQLLVECAQKHVQLLAIQKLGGGDGDEFPLVFNPAYGSNDQYLTKGGDYAFILGQVVGETESEGREVPIEEGLHEGYLQSLEELKSGIQSLFRECNVSSVEAGGAHVFVPPPTQADFVESICTKVTERQQLVKVCNVIVCVFKDSQNHVIRKVLAEVYEKIEGDKSLEAAFAELNPDNDTEINSALLTAARSLATGEFERLFELHDYLRGEECCNWNGNELPDPDDAEGWAKFHLWVLEQLKGSLKSMSADIKRLKKVVSIGVGKIFVSCSSHDRSLIETDLLRTLQELGANPWYYRGEINTGEYWEQEVKEALEASEWFLVVVSENSAESNHVKDEVAWALDNRPGKIIPIVIDDCMPDSINLGMKRIQFADFNNDPEKGKRQLEQLFNKENEATE